MTTTISSSNKNGFGVIYKNSLKKIGGIGLIYFMFSIVLFPMMYFLALDNVKNLAKNFGTMDDIGRFYDNSFWGASKIYPEGMTILYFAIIIIMCIVVGVIVNKYMHDRREVDVYHSLPVKREIMLLANFAAAVTVVVIPVVICYTAVLCGNLTVLKYGFVTTGTILLDMLKVIALILAIESLVFFACVSANSTFDSVIFSMALMEILFALVGTLIWVFQTFMEGVWFEETIFFYIVSLSPANLLYTLLFEVDRVNAAIFNTSIIIWFAAAVVLMFINILVYKRRKSEVAQSNNISNILYKVVICVAAFGVSIFSAVITALMSVYDGIDATVFVAAFAAIYGLLYFFILNGIFSRSVKIRNKSLPMILICTFAAPVFILLVSTGWFGMESYVPEAEKVKSVRINYYDEGRFSNIDYRKYPDSDTNLRADAYSRYVAHPGVIFQEKENITTIVNTHKSIIEGFDREYDYGYNTEADMWDMRKEGRGISFNMIYELESGKTVRRRYYHQWVDIDVAKQFENLDYEAELARQQCPLLAVNSENVDHIVLTDKFNSDRETVKLDSAQLEMLYQAMAADIMSETVEDALISKGMPLGKIEFVYSVLPDDESREYNGYENVKFFVKDYYVNTIEALKKLNLLEKLENDLPENYLMAIAKKMSYSSGEPVYAYALNKGESEYGYELSEMVSDEADVLDVEISRVVYKVNDVDVMESVMKNLRTTVDSCEKYFTVVLYDKDYKEQYKKTGDIKGEWYYVYEKDLPAELAEKVLNAR